LVPGSIDVISKERYVPDKAPDTKKGDQPVFPEKHPYEFRKSVSGKPGNIYDDKNNDGGDETQYKSHLQVILL